MSKTEALQTGTVSAEALANKETFASIQSKFRHEQPAFHKIYKATKKDSTSDLISVEEFARIYKSLWIHLDRLELDLIYTQFAAGIEGKLHWTKFVNRLNILPPTDYNEPDRFLDPLPEPLNSIMEIIELDIIDQAWLTIIQLHPEIPIDDQGNSLVVRKNRNLEVLCAPSAVNKQSTLPTATSSSGDCLFNAYEDGGLVVINTKSGEEQHSVPVFRELIRSRRAPYSIISLSNAVSVLSKNGVPVSRVAMCVAREILKPSRPVEDAPAAAVPAKKAPAKGKAAAPVAVEDTPAPPAREFVLYIKVAESVESESGQRRVGIRMLSDELVCSVTALTVTVDLSSDGKILTVCHSDKCNIYHMSEKEDVAVPAARAAGGFGLPQVPEEKPSSLADDMPPFELTLVSTLIMEKLLPSVEEKAVEKSASVEEVIEVSPVAVKKVNFQKCVPFLLADLTPVKPFKVPAPEDPVVKEMTDPVAIMNKYALIVISDSFPVLQMIGFSPVLPTVGAAPAVPDKKGGGAAQVAVSAAPSADPVGLLSSFVMSTWRLSAFVTAVVTDPSRQLLGLGTADGTVSLWDIPNRSLISVCGKHSAKITSLCFAEGLSNHIFCSGAADGTICFYSIRRSGNSGDNINQFQFQPATRLIDVRQDVPKAAVCCLHALAETSIVICVFDDGTTVAYEAEVGDLLGKLVLYVGMLSQKMDSRPAPLFDLMQLARLHHLNWLVHSMPSVDDGETSDAGLAPSHDEEELISPAASDPVVEFFETARRQVLCNLDLNGLCLFFSDVPKDGSSSSAGDNSPDISIMRATFTTDTIIEHLFPGIATLRRGNDRGKGSSTPSATALYRILSSSERNNPDISSLSIQYVSATPSTAATIDDIKKSRLKKTSALTTENLNAHDNSDLIYKAPAPRLGSVHSSTTLNGQSLGASLIKTLRLRSEAPKHSKKVANRIKQLSNILPSS